ncbi:MAG: TolC family protein [Candidatus Omnitrophica bacterium]|nr:TolC family protein [Candidatus Omnitrophota bacterium]
MKLKSILLISVIFLTGLFSSLYAAEEVLSWQDCIKEAAKNHPDLIAAVEEIKQSQAAKKITASTLFPQIEANASASRARTASDSAPGVTADSYSYGVSATQLIFDGTKTIQDVKAASETIKASQQNYRFTSTQVRLNLRTAFINLLQAQELIRVTEDIIRIRRSNLELITLRYESGLEHRGALLTAEANLAQAEFQLAQAKREIGLAQRQLTKEMGRKEFIPMMVKGDFEVVDPAKEEPDLESLVRNNPSLQQLIAQKNSAEFSLRSAYANFSPTLTGAAGANKAGTHWTPRGDNWNLGLALSMPIFEGGLRLAQVSQAQGLLNQLRENERSTRDGLVVSLARTWAALQDAVETVGVQYKNLIATEERSKIAEAEYATGFITYDNWTIIEDNLVQAKTTYLSAQANALLAEANWIQAKGETLEYAQN